jgi:methylenetetrahydrofolate dehydrogenase (NADP+)/methenyltetrahydrofolate cyclohydrolase
LPCTPHGVQQLLVRSGIQTTGQHVVIVGRSDIVGKPMALMMVQKAAGADATVTVVHSRTKNLPELTRQADILIVAMGKAKFVTAEMVKPGAVVVDVGINRLPDGKICGDVDFDAVKDIAGAISPVPGGVGPLTITMLLQNTFAAAQMS